MGAIYLVPSGLLPNAASALSLVSSRGMAIDFDSLRAAIRIWQQRITPINGEHALGVARSVWQSQHDHFFTALTGNFPGQRSVILTSRYSAQIGSAGC